MKPEQRLALKLTFRFENGGGGGKILLDICVVIFLFFEIHVVIYTVSINVKG